MTTQRYHYVRPGQGDSWYVFAESPEEAIKSILAQSDDALEIQGPNGEVIWRPQAPKKRLFDENDRYNGDGTKLDQEAHAALKAIVYKWSKTHSIRDVQYVIQHTVMDLTLDHLLKSR